MKMLFAPFSKRKKKMSKESSLEPLCSLFCSELQHYNGPLICHLSFIKLPPRSSVSHAAHPARSVLTLCDQHSLLCWGCFKQPLLSFSLFAFHRVCLWSNLVVPHSRHSEYFWNDSFKAPQQGSRVLFLHLGLSQAGSLFNKARARSGGVPGGGWEGEAFQIEEWKAMLITGMGHLEGRKTLSLINFAEMDILLSVANG